jgi:BlaI family transcriptional regulator, penicillinase repressor
VARKPSVTLTETEQQLMEVLWKQGRATVAEVQQALDKRPRPAFNTVQTTLRILEHKGYVGHDEAGRAFVYYPRRDRASVSRAAVHQLVSRFFDGSTSRLAVNLLSDAELSSDDLTRIEKLIAEAKRR